MLLKSISCLRKSAYVALAKKHFVKSNELEQCVVRQPHWAALLCDLLYFWTVSWTRRSVFSFCFCCRDTRYLSFISASQDSSSSSWLFDNSISEQQWEIWPMRGILDPLKPSGISSLNAQMYNSTLTKLLSRGGGLLDDQIPDKKVEVVKDDQRRRGRRPIVVLLN